MKKNTKLKKAEILKQENDESDNHTFNKVKSNKTTLPSNLQSKFNKHGSSGILRLFTLLVKHKNKKKKNKEIANSMVR